MEQKRIKDNWEEEFNIIRRNPIYFIEQYWNKMYPNERIELSDEEKQKFYDTYKMIPLLSENNFHEYIMEYDKLKAQGLKDWEVFI